MWLNGHPSKFKSIICLLIYEGVYALDRHTLFLPPITFFFLLNVHLVLVN